MKILYTTGDLNKYDTVINCFKLSNKGLTFAELVQLTNMKRDDVKNKLRRLVQEGIIEKTKEAGICYYKLIEDVQILRGSKPKTIVIPPRKRVNKLKFSKQKIKEYLQNKNIVSKRELIDIGAEYDYPLPIIKLIEYAKELGVKIKEVQYQSENSC